VGVLEPEGEEAPSAAVAAPPLPLPVLVAAPLLPAPPFPAPDAAAEVILPVAEATGVVMVHGQFVIVKVCDAEAVYVWPLWTRVVAPGQNVV
jgi:hypothetical protein